MIEGVKIEDLLVIPDDRGYLMEMFRSDSPDFQKFGQVYMTVVYPGVVKAWHYHMKQTDNFVCVAGMAKVALHDAREGSPTKGKTMTVMLGWQRQRRLSIPAGVYHGFTPVGGRPGLHHQHRHRTLRLPGSRRTPSPLGRPGDRLRLVGHERVTSGRALTSGMKVGIVLATYNGGRFLSRTAGELPGPGADAGRVAGQRRRVHRRDPQHHRCFRAEGAVPGEGRRQPGAPRFHPELRCGARAGGRGHHLHERPGRRLVARQGLHHAGSRGGTSGQAVVRLRRRTGRRGPLADGSDHLRTEEPGGRRPARSTYGCCFALRRDLLDYVLPIPDGYDFHDKWIAHLAKDLGVLQPVDVPLQLYRRHGANTSWITMERPEDRPGRAARARSRVGADVRFYLRQNADQARLRADRLERLAAELGAGARSPVLDTAGPAAHLRGVLQRLEARLALLERPRLLRLPGVVRMLAGGDYRHFSGVRSAVADLARK